MALLILLFLRLRRFRVSVPTSVFYRGCAAVWVVVGLVLGLGIHHPASLLYMVGAWCYWLIGHEAAAPGWCRKWLQRLDLHHWPGRLEWLSNWCLVAAVATSGSARAWWAGAWLLSRAGHYYTTRPRPVPVKRSPLPVPPPIPVLPPPLPEPWPNYYATCALVAQRLNVPVVQVWQCSPAYVQSLAKWLQQLPPTL